MLQDSDLETFVELFRRVSGGQSSLPAMHPAAVLHADNVVDQRLQPGDHTALWHSLKVACAAGDASDLSFYVFDKIVRQFDERKHYVDLRSLEKWERAIRWAHDEVATSGPDVPELHESDRRSQVGMACLRMRSRGYDIPIGAFGPNLTSVRQQIVDKIRTLVSRIGGLQVARVLCELARREGRVHDGFWVFGTPVTMSIRQVITPALPIGWLFSLAIRYLHVRPSSNDSAADWEILSNLATDYAACLDCQRYSMFEATNLQPHEFVNTLEELFKWREIFSLPQVPPMTMPVLRKALLSADWPPDTRSLRREVKRLLFESMDLLHRSAEDDLTTIARYEGRRHYPRLWQHATAKPGKANAGYVEPFDAHKRNHDHIVFFETGSDSVLLLPSALTASAVCHVIFGLIHRTMHQQTAAEFVGATLEKAIRISCTGKTDSPATRLVYCAGKQRFEIDAAARSDTDVIFFESKAKSLTTRSRSGDTLSLIDDFTKSYLSLVEQLVRHEGNLRRGLIPITNDDEDLTRIHVRMIAVSPLSYGPASDTVLASALVRALLGARVTSTDSDDRSVRVVQDFANKVRSIESELADADPRVNKRISIPGYFTNVMWLDLGQLVYLLRRSRSAGDALARHITFGTGDFWTETAYLDRQRQSAGK